MPIEDYHNLAYWADDMDDDEVDAKERQAEWRDDIPPPHTDEDAPLGVLTLDSREDRA